MIPLTDRWRPETIEELQSYIDSGVAKENQFVDFKQQLPPKNTDTARHLAGFAIDGGELVIGVAEPRSGEFEIRPIEHAGLPEKIDQIARSSVDPPLLVETRTLVQPSDPSTGVVWVSIPPSPQAPHQVGGAYYMRADKQTVPMSDPEVERLSRARRITLEGIESLLRETMEKDTTGELPHIIGVARPLGAAPDELYDAVGGREGLPAFGIEVLNALEFHMPHAAFEPNRYTLRSHHRSDVTKVPKGARKELSLAYDGGLRWLSDDASFVSTQFDPTGARFLSPEQVVCVCVRLLRATQTVAAKTGHRRAWDVGIGVTRTRGLEGSPYYRSVLLAWEGVPPFPDEDYTAVQRVNHLQIENQPWEIVRSLTHGFVEGCGFSFEAIAKSAGYSPDEG